MPLYKDTSAYCVRPLAKMGYKVIVVEYNLCPRISLAEITEQIIKFGKYILKYASDMGSRHVSVSGHSAGAHLAAFLVTPSFLNETPNSDLLKNVYLFSGVYDLMDLRWTECVNQDNLLSLTDENTIALSPIFFDYATMRDRNINVHIFVAENDSGTFIEQGKLMWEQMVGESSDEETRVKYHLLKDLDHFDIVENLRNSSYTITKLIAKNYE